MVGFMLLGGLLLIYLGASHTISDLVKTRNGEK